MLNVDKVITEPDLIIINTYKVIINTYKVITEPDLIQPFRQHSRGFMEWS